MVVSAGLTVQVWLLTQMQMKAGVQPCPSSMPDEVSRRLPRPQVLVALPYRVVFRAAVVTIGHQDGDLGAQLRQLERTWRASAGVHMVKRTSCTHMQLL
jgi:hypothetical protein